MAEDHPADAPSLQTQLALLKELEQLVRQQDRVQQAAVAQTHRLRLAIEAAVTRLGAMLSGERASRAALQAVIDDLRTAVVPADGVDTDSPSRD